MLRIGKLINDAIIPFKAHSTDTGFDVIAMSDPKIVGEEIPMTGKYKTVDYIQYDTNLKLDLEIFNNPICSIFLFPRSSVSKYNLILKNSVGIGDHSYKGKYLFRFAYQFQPEDFELIDNKLTGQVNKEKIYKKGDKIGQLVIQPVHQAKFIEIDKMKDSLRGEGGHGSTGI